MPTYSAKGFGFFDKGLGLCDYCKEEMEECCTEQYVDINY